MRPHRPEGSVTVGGGRSGGQHLFVPPDPLHQGDDEVAEEGGQAEPGGGGGVGGVLGSVKTADIAAKTRLTLLIKDNIAVARLLHNAAVGSSGPMQQ